MIPVRISLDLVPTRLGLPLAAGASGSKLVRAGMIVPNVESDKHAAKRDDHKHPVN